MALDPRRIPFIGGDIYQAGQVYDIVSQGCAPDPWIAVKGFFAYTPQLLFSLLKPELWDVTFTRKGRRHRTIRRRGFEALFTVEMPAPKSPGVYWALAHSFQLVERLGWYFIVVDATTDFAVNWSSMAYTFSGCQTGLAHTASFSSSGHRIGAVANGGWISVTGDAYIADPPAGASASAIALLESSPHTIVAHVTGHTTPFRGDNGGMIGARLIRHHGGQQDLLPLTHSFDAGEKTGFSVAEADYLGNTAGWTYTLQTQWGGGIAWIDSMHVELTMAPPSGLDADP
jgi:hypothetical protein